MSQRKRKPVFQPGDVVTVTVPWEACYSGYGSRPQCYMMPGDVGVIISGPHPSVRRERVDFYNLALIDRPGPGKGENVWQVAPRPAYIERLDP